MDSALGSALVSGMDSALVSGMDSALVSGMDSALVSGMDSAPLVLYYPFVQAPPDPMLIVYT